MDEATKVRLHELVDQGDVYGLVTALGGGANQALYERGTLAHWLGLVPDLDSVSVIVRRGGKVARTVVLVNPVATPASRASASPCLAPEG